MFGRKQKKAIEVTKLSSLIADNLHIIGDVLFSGGLRVDGKIEGSVVGKIGEKSLIVLSEKGTIAGRVHAYDAVVNGTISGDLEVENFLELQSGANVSGSISYRQLQMECGATVEGKLIRVIDEPATEAGKGRGGPAPGKAAQSAPAPRRAVERASPQAAAGASSPSVSEQPASAAIALDVARNRTTAAG